MILALLPAAYAGATVLVSTLQPRNPEATGLAALVENFLAMELDEHPDLDVIRVEDTPAFDDYPARTYMEGCPPGDASGCTLVVAQRGGASWAVTGSVQALVSGTRVTIDIIDVDGARTVLSFQSELDAGNDEAFAEGVAKVLMAAISGEFEERDVRERDTRDPEAERAHDEAVARQLEELSRELGEVSAVVTRDDTRIERPRYTVEDLAEKVAAGGETPWERLDMSAAEYLRFKNAGVSVAEWRRRAMGRAGQVLVRPWAGWSRGPYAGTYYGRYAYDAETLQVVDAYAAQGVQSTSSAAGGFSVGYGLSPWVDVGAVVALTGGPYVVDIDQEVIGETRGQRPATQYGDVSVHFGPRVTVGPLPNQRVRPVAGVGFLFGRGPGVADKIAPPPELPTWDAPWLVTFEPFLGGEARLSDKVDVWALVPVDVLVGGETAHAQRSGTVDEVVVFEPDAAADVGFGVQVGLQVRIGGRAPKETSRVEELEAEDE